MIPFGCEPALITNPVTLFALVSLFAEKTEVRFKIGFGGICLLFLVNRTCYRRSRLSFVVIGASGECSLGGCTAELSVLGIGAGCLAQLV